MKYAEKNIRIELPENVGFIIGELETAGFEAFAVGGCVRDSILGRLPEDWDITTSAKPEEIKSVFRKTVDTGIEHGTVTVLKGGETYEVTTYRIDGSYSDGRHPDSVEFTPLLSEDLKRRDFTINAMAYSDKLGLIDEFGGISDIDGRIIRCVGEPRERFEEDALRMLRALRFSAQLGFEIERATAGAVQELAASLVKVSRERIFAELNKLLLSERPEGMLEVFELGLSDYIGEEWKKLSSEDCRTISNASKLPEEKYIRWAAFLGGLSEAEGIRLLRELKSDNANIRRVQAILENKSMALPENKKEARRAMSLMGGECYEDIIRLRLAGFINTGDSERKLLAALDFKNEILEAREAYDFSGLAIGGSELITLGMKPGREIGNMLTKLLNLVIESPEKNTPEILQEYVIKNMP